MSGFFSALQFLTVLPAPLAKQAGRPSFSAIYFPAVGLLLGALLAGLDIVLRQFMPISLTNAAVIIALIVLTGGLHLDGFMDTCDAVPGAHSTTRRLEILKDVRVGSYGTLGVLCLIMAKYLALDALPVHLRTQSLFLMPVVGRWAMTLVIPLFPYARAGGLGTSLKSDATWLGLGLATLAALAVASLALQLPGVAILVGAAILALLMGVYFTRRLSGLTGDTYGAINEVVEVVMLVMIPLAAGAYRL